MPDSLAWRKRRGDLSGARSQIRLLILRSFGNISAGPKRTFAKGCSGSKSSLGDEPLELPAGERRGGDTAPDLVNKTTPNSAYERAGVLQNRRGLPEHS